MGIIEQKPDENQSFLDSSPAEWAAKEKTDQANRDATSERRLGQAMRDSMENPRGEASKFILEITGAELPADISADDLKLKLRAAREQVRQQPELQTKLVEFYNKLR